MPTIMIVDEEKNMIDQVKSLLHAESIHIIHAENTRKALEYIDHEPENKINLILVDTYIPGTDQKGYFSLKTNSRFTDGALDDLLPKPFTKDQLLSYIWKKL